jgi:hypothetical protein
MAGDENAVLSWIILRNMILLRREKASINLGLPTKVEQVRKLQFDPVEQEIHETLRQHYGDKLRELKKMNISDGKLQWNALTFLVHMRRFCTHKQEMLAADQLRFMQGKPLGDLNQEDDESESASASDKLTKSLALDILLIHAVDAIKCDICHQILTPDESDTETNCTNDSPTETMCHVLQCYKMLCGQCFETYQKEAKTHLEIPGFAFCNLCDRPHLLSSITISHRELQERIQRDDLIKSHSKLSSAAEAYISPSPKVKYLLENLAKFKQWDDDNPEAPPNKV